MRQVAAVFASLVFFSVSVQAADVAGGPKRDLAKGKEVFSQTCVACHGADGNSASPLYPKLAGLPAEYVYKQLLNFKPSKDNKGPLRENAVMNGMVAALSDEDMRNVAAWLESGSMKPSASTNRETIALGQAIYRGGLADRKVPACAACHGPTGAGIPAQYPRLAGQHAQYIESQLVAFKQGTRHNNEPMQTIAARLSDKEMKAVSDYVAGLR